MLFLLRAEIFCFTLVHSLFNILREILFLLQSQSSLWESTVAIFRQSAEYVWLTTSQFGIIVFYQNIVIFDL